MKCPEISIADKIIGEGNPCLLVAEIGQNHEGSLGLAHSYIDAIAESGFDAVKFQTHIAESESTYDEKFRVHFSLQDDTRYDYWKRMEFTADQWRGLYQHCNDKGLIFLSSAFSLDAVRLLHSLGTPAWKVGSGEFKSEDLLSEMFLTGKPILLSTGMSKYQEIDQMVKKMQKRKVPYAVLQCTSMYPTPPEAVGLNLLSEMREKYSCPVGFSDHSGEIYASLAAMALGINIYECHVTFDKRMFGPDVVASLTIEDLKFLAKARDQFFIMQNNPVCKNKMAQKLNKMRKLFSKSIAPSRPLKRGTILSEEMLTLKKPGTGIPVSQKNELIGKKLIRDVCPNRLLNKADLED